MITQEDKELLLKDLCARLPYTVFIDPVDSGKTVLIGIKEGGLLLFDTIHNEEYDRTWNIEYCKPYLRPISSMTEEEEEEFISFTDTMFRYGKDNNLCCLPLDAIHWLNAHHFDYRGLIEKGLAIEAPEGMYN